MLITVVDLRADRTSLSIPPSHSILKAMLVVAGACGSLLLSTTVVLHNTLELVVSDDSPLVAFSCFQLIQINFLEH